MRDRPDQSADGDRRATAHGLMIDGDRVEVVKHRYRRERSRQVGVGLQRLRGEVDERSGLDERPHNGVVLGLPVASRDVPATDLRCRRDIVIRGRRVPLGHVRGVDRMIDRHLIAALFDVGHDPERRAGRLVVVRHLCAAGGRRELDPRWIRSEQRIRPLSPGDRRRAGEPPGVERVPRPRVHKQPAVRLCAERQPDGVERRQQLGTAGLLLAPLAEQQRRRAVGQLGAVDVGAVVPTDRGEDRVEAGSPPLSRAARDPRSVRCREQVDALD